MPDDTAKLRSKLESYALILDKLDHPTWQRDAALNLVYYNLAFSTIVEERADDVISAEAIELFGNAKDIARKALRTGEPQIIRKPLVIGGQRRLYEITEMPHKDGTVGYATDVSGVEEIEHKLAQHIAVQNDLMESTASAIAIYGADMRLKFYNRAFMLLWKLDEAFLNTSPGYADVLEALREKAALPEQANFRSFKKENLGFFTSLREKHEEHYYLPDDRVLKVVIIPHELGGLLFSYEDLTDHIALERSYNTLISVKAHTLDNLFEGVAVFGQNGKLQLSNPTFARMWKLDRNALISNRPHISEILESTCALYRFDGEWSDFRQQIIAQANARTASRQTLLRTDGTILEWATIPLPDGATLLTYMDITDSYRVAQSLRAEKEALQAADKLKNNFLSNVSYEFRSPLTSIKGFTEILLSGLTGAITAKQKEYLGDILTASESLAVLIDDIMDAASMEAGYMKLERKPVDVRKLLDAVVQTVNETLSKKHIRLILQYGEGLGALQGDHDRLSHAFGNLIRNSAVLKSEGGELILTAMRDEDDIVVTIYDDAKDPIPREKWDTGLELTIARRFIEMHGGSIRIESGVATGTHIVCRLPA